MKKCPRRNPDCCFFSKANLLTSISWFLFRWRRRQWFHSLIHLLLHTFLEELQHGTCVFDDVSRGVVAATKNECPSAHLHISKHNRMRSRRVKKSGSSFFLPLMVVSLRYRPECPLAIPWWGCCCVMKKGRSSHANKGTHYETKKHVNSMLYTDHVLPWWACCCCNMLRQFVRREEIATNLLNKLANFGEGRKHDANSPDSSEILIKRHFTTGIKRVPDTRFFAPTDLETTRERPAAYLPLTAFSPLVLTIKHNK